MAHFTIIKAVPVPRAEGVGPSMPHFAAGDRLLGRVLKLETDGRVLVDLGGPRVLAKLGFEVRPGQALKLTVVDRGPPLHLKASLQETGNARPPAVGSGSSRPMPVPDQPSAGPMGLDPSDRRQLRQLLRQLLPPSAARASAPAPARTLINALEQMRTALEPLPMDKPAVDIAKWLRRTLENHGGLFEKRMADIATGAGNQRTGASAAVADEARVRAVISRDLKPQLMLLKNLLGGADPDPAAMLKADQRQLGTLMRGVEKMLHHLEQQQERGVTRAAEGDALQVLSHSLPVEEQRPPVQLKVYYPRKSSQDGDDRPHRIALLLEMDRLGPVRGEIAQTDQGLQVRFHVRDAEVQMRFQERSHEIVEALGDRFDAVRVSVAVDPQKIAQFHNEDAPEADGAGIDIKV